MRILMALVIIFLVPFQSAKARDAWRFQTSSGAEMTFQRPGVVYYSDGSGVMLSLKFLTNAAHLSLLESNAAALEAESEEICHGPAAPLIKKLIAMKRKITFTHVGIILQQKLRKKSNNITYYKNYTTLFHVEKGQCGRKLSPEQ